MNRMWNALTYEGKCFVVGVGFLVVLCFLLGFMCGNAEAESMSAEDFRRIRVGMRDYQIMGIAGVPSYTIDQGTASYTYEKGEQTERHKGHRYEGHRHERKPHIRRERVMWIYRGGRDNQYNAYLLIEDGVLIEKSRKRD